MTNYLDLLKFIHGYRRRFVLALMSMGIASGFRVFELSMLVPLVDRIFNNKQIVLPNQNLPAFLIHAVEHMNSIPPQVIFHWLPFIVLLGMVVKHSFTYIYEYMMNDIAQRVMRDMRQKLYEKIQSFSLDYFSKKRTGELMARITNDVNIVENAVSYGVTDLFVQSFTILGCLICAFFIHFKAAVIIFCLFPMIIVPIAQLGRNLRKIARSTQERMADINSILLESISGIRVIKAFCTEDYERQRFLTTNQSFYKLRMKAAKRLILQGPITEIFGAVCGIAIILWLGKQVMDARLSSGILILFFGSVMSVISPVKKLGNVNAIVQQALAANERIYEVLGAEPSVQEKPSVGDLSAIQREIAFNNVSFSYDQESGQILHGIDLTIKVGELVAIVGPTGTGKTTLVNLIPRFYDPNEGSVCIDGTDIREVTIRSLRSQIGIVSQETFLFNDTVKANIAYGDIHTQLGKVESAAKRAYAHAFITALPQGYNTVIGDRGFRLSGGEKQRVAIARAIFKNPPILILDEATSQLDSESEKYVQEALDDLMRGRTTIAIAHRLSTIKKADKIVVLDKGRVVGTGKHEALLKTCDLYRRLYETQFQM